MKRNIYDILAIAALSLLAACASDEPGPTPGPQPDPAPQPGVADVRTTPIISFGTPGDSPVATPDWSSPMPGSRTMEDAPSYDSSHDIASIIPESIGVWCYNNRAGDALTAMGYGEVFRNQEMFFIDGEKCPEELRENWKYTDESRWPYTPEQPWLVSTDEQPARYKFFAYAPIAGYGVDGIEAFGKSYDAFNQIIWYHIPRYSAEDYMISETLKTYTARKAGEGENDVQEMAMVHLQARIRFCFRLGERFGELRYIHVRKVEVENLHGQRLTLILNYTKNGTETDAFGNVNDLYDMSYTWTKETMTTELQSVELQNERNLFDPEVDGIYLRADNRFDSEDNILYQPMASLYIYPYDDLASVNLKVTYDVYDIHDQLLRKGDVARNSIDVMLGAGGGAAGEAPRTLHPGFYYDVKIQIEPRFLYVLSDNDFDFDGFLVINNN